MNEIIKKNGISYGIITGVVSALITTAIYSIDINLFTAWWVTVVNILIYITIAVVLLSKTKKELNGVFPFKDAFTTYFISAVVGILISVVFNILLFNFIDPAAKEQILEITINKTVEMMQRFDTPKDILKETVKGMKENDQYSIANIIKGSAMGIVFSSIIGLIIAAIMKSKTTYNE